MGKERRQEGAAQWLIVLLKPCGGADPRPLLIFSWALELYLLLNRNQHLCGNDFPVTAKVKKKHLRGGSKDFIPL